jgi:hypothetical protein
MSAVRPISAVRPTTAIRPTEASKAASATSAKRRFATLNSVATTFRFGSIPAVYLADARVPSVRFAPLDPGRNRRRRRSPFREKTRLAGRQGVGRGRRRQGAKNAPHAFAPHHPPPHIADARNLRSYGRAMGVCRPYERRTGALTPAPVSWPPAPDNPSVGNVVLFCGLGNHVDLRGLPGG